MSCVIGAKTAEFMGRCRLPITVHVLGLQREQCIAVLLPRDQKVFLRGCSVIKMEVCFNKDALGHSLPTELASILPV